MKWNKAFQSSQPLFRSDYVSSKSTFLLSRYNGDEAPAVVMNNIKVPSLYFNKRNTLILQDALVDTEPNRFNVA